MAKYCFDVSLVDNKSVHIIPNDMEEKAELYDYDRYTNEVGNYVFLCNQIANKLGVRSGDISQIKILQQRTGIKFSLITTNPYLTPILNSVSRKKINGYKNYQSEESVIDSSNKTFMEMKEYLFDNLNNNHEKFLSEIYLYNNEFSKLLFQYGVLCKQFSDNEENLIHLREIKEKIIKGLSIYKNYRGLCKARYDYENRHNFIQRRNQNNERPVIEIKPKEPVFDATYFTQEPTYGYKSSYINDLGEEKEEFLDSNEIESEDFYGKGR